MIRIMVHNIVLLILIILQASCQVSPYAAVNTNDATLHTSPILQLEEKYSVYLDSTWTAKQADALLKTFESIPAVLNLRFSQWSISDKDLENGIKIELKDKLKIVTMSRYIFPVEEDRETLSPGKELYSAVVQFLTESGTNRAIIELILQKRYGLYVPSYDSLTEDTPSKMSKRYSNFENEDLMLIISVFEEFPQALHKISRLAYIVRRIDNEEDIGISTARTGRGCIEFAESIFRRRNSNTTRRVIAHEKAHFLWAFVFSRALRAEWAKLGGWHRDASESGWSTTKERSAFVSDYASEKNPNEDMAESIAHYLISPHRLRSCCPEKYEFIHRIMLMYTEGYEPPNLM